MEISAGSSGRRMKREVEGKEEKKKKEKASQTETGIIREGGVGQRRE